jgi:hypothetical protein
MARHASTSPPHDTGRLKLTSAALLACTLRKRGILAIRRRRKMRFVTHSRVDDASADSALEASETGLK